MADSLLRRSKRVRFWRSSFAGGMRGRPSQFRLLSSKTHFLRRFLLPHKGTIIEKLSEETLRYWNHLTELLFICEAQRQIGEAYLNETSSRSHQILRVVSVGQRLKEGCHINHMKHKLLVMKMK
nr:kinesin-like protein KIN-7E isoform X1 [Ipomoea batatas]